MNFIEEKYSKSNDNFGEKFSIIHEFAESLAEKKLVKKYTKKSKNTL
jgi:hypothetical protein